jgi:hypothetical protein
MDASSVGSDADERREEASTTSRNPEDDWEGPV